MLGIEKMVPPLNRCREGFTNGGKACITGARINNVMKLLM